MNGVASFSTSRGVVWKIRYRVPVVPGARRTRQKTETLRHCEGRRDAEGVLAAREASIFNRTYRPGAPVAIRVDDEAEAFLAAVKPVDPKNPKDGELASWRWYRSAFTHHLLPHFGKMYLSEVATSDCEAYRKRRRVEGDAEATIRNELRYFQSMYAWARAEKHCDNDPVSGVTFKKIDNARRREPSDAECKKIAEYIVREPDVSFFRPLLVTLYCSTLRLQSILTLRWENIDLEAASAKTKQKGGTWVTIHLPPLLVAELKRWKPWSEGLARAGWVFPSSRDLGDHVGQTAVSKRWKKMLAETKITDLIRHDFRRRMQTALLRAGADKGLIKRGAGGASERIIDEHYDARQRAEIAPLLERVTDLKLISESAMDEHGATDDGKESAG